MDLVFWHGNMTPGDILKILIRASLSRFSRARLRKSRSTDLFVCSFLYKWRLSVLEPARLKLAFKERLSLGIAIEEFNECLGHGKKTLVSPSRKVSQLPFTTPKTNWDWLNRGGVGTCVGTTCQCCTLHSSLVEIVSLVFISLGRVKRSSVSTFWVTHKITFKLKETWKW